MPLTRLTVRDHVATALVALIIVPYLVHLAWDEAPLLQEPRGLAGLGLVLGFSAFVIIRGADALDWTGLAEVGLALASLALGLAGTTAAEALLAAFIVSILVVWSVEILDHAGLLPSHHASGTA